MQHGRRGIVVLTVNVPGSALQVNTRARTRPSRVTSYLEAE